MISTHGTLRYLCCSIAVFSLLGAKEQSCRPATDALIIPCSEGVDPATGQCLVACTQDADCLDYNQLCCTGCTEACIEGACVVDSCPRCGAEERCVIEAAACCFSDQGCTETCESAEPCQGLSEAACFSTPGCQAHFDEYCSLDDQGAEQCERFFIDCVPGEQPSGLPCGIDSCPAAVDCMPSIPEEMACLCTSSGIAAMATACPDTGYSF